MGYESRVYVVRSTENVSSEHNWYFTVAAFDMCYMGRNYGWNELWKNEIDAQDEFYGIEEGEPITEDAYGDKPRIAEPVDVLNVLESFNASEDYWRAKMLETCIRQVMADSDGSKIKIIHVGH